ncbi:DUF2282 domain-containing protein [Rhodospirillaceae bacterium SYSU D60014]|uniref:BufA1 family periplasmic bufferin-type metallophore n=1 Tax=Virgifigura deserti TaxID=2268457 RepID=UPI000E6660F3
MNRTTLAASTLAAAVGLVLAAQGFPAGAQQTDPKAQTMERMQEGNLEKCYGIAAKGKNDCAEGAHSCAGQATQDRDPASFVLLPKGDCSKIAGGSTTAA